MHDEPEQEKLIEITELSKGQRRVLGVLLEKAFTTPEYYPLTLKAVVTGSNQKSNRMPVMTMTEEDAEEFAEQLREMGLLAVVHTETGRSERYRHYMRRRTPMTEAQLAIMTELLLRGRQSIGDLRSRIKRMVEVESLPELRRELNTLIDMGHVRANADLERRSVEIDHNWYRTNENIDPMPTLPAAAVAPAATPRVAAPNSPVSSTPAAPSASNELVQRIEKLESTCEKLTATNQELEQQLEDMTRELTRLENAFDDLRQDLGG